MKIALCTRRFIPPFVGGVDVYTDRLRRALERLGHEVIILAFDASADICTESIILSLDEYDDTKVWRFKFAFDGRPQQAFDYAYDQEMGQVIKGVLQEQKPNLFIIMNFYTITLAPVETAKDLGIPVVHIATDFLPICRRATFIRWDGNPCQVGESIKSCSSCFVSHHVLGRLASKILNRVPEDTLVRWANNPAIYTPPHPLWLLKPYWKQATIMDQRLKTLRPLRENIDLVLAPTQYTLNAFLANGFKTDQVHFLPFAIEADHPLSNIEHVPSTHTRFVFVGRLQPYKGAHLLVEAFNNVQAPKGATLTIYGAAADGYETYFNQLQAAMASNERIQFAGKISPNNLDDAFAKADYFVLPSIWHENSPLIVLDALQSKTPVIASDIGGITDIVKNEVNGLLFPMGDKAALQQVLQRVINQPTLAEQLSSGVTLPNIDTYAGTLIELCNHRVTLPEFNTKVLKPSPFVEV